MWKCVSVYTTLCLLCMLLLDLSSAFVLTSSNAVLNFSRLDLAPNLKKFIEHEEIRLRVIQGVKKHKQEVRLVEQRIEEFKSLGQELSDNRTANEDLITSYVGNHPTSLFVALRNFVTNWDHKFDNTTLYGTRLKEFIDTDNASPLPDKQDLHRAATALSVIQEVYNLSVSELTSGRVNSQQGAPLSPADSLYIGKIILNDGLLDRAAVWVKSAVDSVDLDSITKDTKFTFNISEALATLAKLAFQTEKDQRAALELFEKAVDLDPENDALHSEYMRHRSGRNVTPLPGADVTAIESWKQKYFDMCHNSTNVTNYDVHNKTNPRLRCRYKRSSSVPYVLYKEEILNVVPYVSVIYDFVSDSQADRIKNASVEKLTEYTLPGNSRATMWQYRGSVFFDDEDHVFANVSWKVGDVTGLSVKQSRSSQEYSLGEPAHVIDYGIGGLTLPHADNKKMYQTSYMKVKNGNRYATMLVQLSDVTVGGATVFIEQNITIAPRKGMAVLMYHYLPQGDPEQSFFVGTCPLALGENVVLEKGIWMTIFEPTNVCGKKPSSSHLMKEAVLARYKAAVQANRLRALQGDKTDRKKTQEGQEENSTGEDKDKPEDNEEETEKREEVEDKGEEEIQVEDKEKSEEDQETQKDGKELRDAEDQTNGEDDENKEKGDEEEKKESSNEEKEIPRDATESPKEKEEEEDSNTEETNSENEKDPSNEGEQESLETAELPEEKEPEKDTRKEKNDSDDENKVKQKKTKSKKDTEEKKGKPQIKPKDDVKEDK